MHLIHENLFPIPWTPHEREVLRGLPERQPNPIRRIEGREARPAAPSLHLGPNTFYASRLVKSEWWQTHWSRARRFPDVREDATHA